jgi:hypothetical protein
VDKIVKMIRIEFRDRSSWLNGRICDLNSWDATQL